MAFNLLDSYENQSILHQEIRTILNSNFKGVYENDRFFNFRCNVCGDSKTNKLEKRGYIIKDDKKGWRYYCHNGGCGGKNLLTWIKTYFPANYRNMMDQMMTNRTKEYTKSYKNITTVKSEANPNDEKEIFKTFKPLKNYPEMIAWVESRGITEDVYKRWYFCETGAFKKRIIIPAYNNKGKIYFYQGRAVESWMSPKYKSRTGSEFNNIYSYYTVDRDKPVMLLEGPIDHFFVENSIAATGLKVGDEKLDAFENLHYLLDNDEAGYKVGLKLLKLGKSVFIWKRFLKDHSCSGEVKDVNDFILKNKQGIKFLTWELVNDYFSNRIVDKIFLV